MLFSTENKQVRLFQVLSKNIYGCQSAVKSIETWTERIRRWPYMVTATAFGAISASLHFKAESYA